MKRYAVIDTNVLIRYFRGDEPFAELVETSESVIVHPVVYAEYMNGLDEGRKSGKLLRRRLEEFLDAPPVVLANVSTTTSLYYSKIYKALKGSGRMIPQNDIWIAASAIEKGYVLATHDEHFSQIPMLRLAASRDLSLPGTTEATSLMSFRQTEQGYL